jgi:hypothetical protein
VRPQRGPSYDGECVRIDRHDPTNVMPGAGPGMTQ